MGKFYSTKTFGTDRGLSCCFRQWRATHSHCQFLHGYSIGIKLIFECDSLDERNWVMDFGGLKVFKEWANHMFDHTTVIAEDDPLLPVFMDLSKRSTLKRYDGYNSLTSSGSIAAQRAIDLRVVPGVGCERFAQLCFEQMEKILTDAKANNILLNPTVRIKSVEVFEHGANSAIYEL
jgi:6-pyruvoyltetrahydropterin/6-carboxytetrahydropterin synthase